MYSPKISEDLIPVLFRLSKEDGVPMTKLVDKLLRLSLLTNCQADELRDLLKNKKVVLDCGHRWTNHNLSNTMVITAEGITYCHECYF